MRFELLSRGVNSWLNSDSFPINLKRLEVFSSIHLQCSRSCSPKFHPHFFNFSLTSASHLDAWREVNLWITLLHERQTLLATINESPSKLENISSKTSDGRSPMTFIVIAVKSSFTRIKKISLSTFSKTQLFCFFNVLKLWEKILSEKKLNKFLRPKTNRVSQKYWQIIHVLLFKHLFQ